MCVSVCVCDGERERERRGGRGGRGMIHSVVVWSAVGLQLGDRGTDSSSRKLNRSSPLRSSSLSKNSIRGKGGDGMPSLWHARRMSSVEPRIASSNFDSKYGIYNLPFSSALDLSVCLSVCVFFLGGGGGYDGNCGNEFVCK